MESLQRFREFAPNKLQEYKEKLQSACNRKDGIRGLDRILFESPPRTRWWKAIVAATGYWILIFFIPEPMNKEVLDDLMAFGMLICWPLLPIAIFMDSKVAPEYTANWRPDVRKYVISSLIPLGGLVAGPVYLIRRWW